MFILFRIYRFKRRCGMPRRCALMSALRSVLRDLNLRSPL
jgi:hypothetical protein